MHCRLLTILIFIVLQTGYLQTNAQFNFSEKVIDLSKQAVGAKNDSDKIVAIGQLAELYYAYNLKQQGDSLLQKQLIIAELSQNKNLILNALFDNSTINLSSWNDTKTLDRSLNFVQQGLDYANELGRKDYAALAYIRKATLLRLRGQYENAQEQINKAITTLGDAQIDTISARLFLEMGKIYMAKSDAVSAYQNFTTAFDIAYKIKNTPLQSEVYHQFAELYRSLNDADLAKANLINSLTLNTSHNYVEGILQDYYDLARLTDKKEYIEKALSLADSIHSIPYVLKCKNLMFFYYMVVEKNSNVTLSYLNNNQDLKQSFLNNGSAYFNWLLGHTYFYSNKPDSALYYYKLSQPELEKQFDVAKTKKDIYQQIGQCYVSLNQPQNALLYFEKTIDINKNNLIENGPAFFDLSKLYAQVADFKKAYTYNQLYITYKDSLEKLNAKSKVVLLNVEREEKRHEQDMTELAAKNIRNRNLQYMAITIAIATVFFIMILMGAFPVSKGTIKILGYFAFISLFEFLVMLLDSFLHKITHGEPLKMWMIKIFLIAMLVPFQHFLEHGLIQFLSSQKLLIVRRNLAFKKFWIKRKKAIAADPQVNIEQDTAVL